MIGYIKKFRDQFYKDWSKLYHILRDNNYDDLFPGISDPSNENKFLELYHWAFNCD